MSSTRTSELPKISLAVVGSGEKLAVGKIARGGKFAGAGKKAGITGWGGGGSAWDRPLS